MADFGRTKGTSLYLDCDSPLMVGVPIHHTEGGIARTMQVQSAGVADDAIQGRHIKGIDGILFGSAVTIGAGLVNNFATVIADGTASISGMTGPASNVYTMTQDLSCKNFIVKTAATVITNGYRIFCQYMQLNGACIIQADGNNGVASTTQTGAANGTGSAPGTLGVGKTSNKGGNGGAIGGAGTNGTAGSAATTSKGGGGGNGAPGATSTGAGGSAPSPALVTLSTAAIDFFLNAQALLDQTTVPPILISGGTGGSPGGGGGGGGAATGGGAGSGGNGGNVLMISSAVIEAIAWTGRISANGGNGGNGFVAAGAGNGGVGGGGGGGLAVVLCRKWIGTLPVLEAKGGSASSPGAISANGGIAGTVGNTSGSSVGAPGTVVHINMTVPQQYQDEYGDTTPIATRPHLTNYPPRIPRNRKPF